MESTNVYNGRNSNLVLYIIKFISLRSDKVCTVNEFPRLINHNFSNAFCIRSIITYLKVCRKMCFDTGKYDHKLWLITLPIIVVLQILAGPFYGQSKYW